MIRALPTTASAFLLCGSLLAAISIPVFAQVSGLDSMPDSRTAWPAAPLPPLTMQLRTRLWLQASADPVAWLMPGFDAALALAHPPRQQGATHAPGSGYRLSRAGGPRTGGGAGMLS